MTIKGPHGSGDGNASIFSGLSRVPAIFRNQERYLTLRDRFQGISVCYLKDLGTCMCVDNEDEEKDRKKKRYFLYRAQTAIGVLH